MPYKLKKVKGGWQVTSPGHPQGFKKKPHANKGDAMDQLAAIKIHAKESIDLIRSMLQEAMDEKPLDKKTPTEEELAAKYGVDISTIREAVKIGTGVEYEHTGDPEIAKEIALDHLGEKLDYYEKLKANVE